MSEEPQEPQEPREPREPQKPQEPQEPTLAPEGLAALGGPAEAEPPVHTTDLDAGWDAHSGTGSGTASGAEPPAPLEDSAAYEVAVQDGALLSPAGEDPGAGPLAPEFREPGAP